MSYARRAFMQAHGRWLKFSLFLSLWLVCTSLVDQANVPTDIPASVLNKTSEVIDAQLGYVKQLGTYIKTSLKVWHTQPYNQHHDPLAFDLTI